MAPLLAVEAIETYYGASQALFGVSFALHRGEVLALLGRNGMGKTTAVRSIVGLAPVARGRIIFDGEPVQIWTLQSRLRDHLKGNSSKSVLVVTDEVVPSGRLVEVVDQARLAGAEDIGVATSAEAGEG